MKRYAIIGKDGVGYSTEDRGLSVNSPGTEKVEIDEATYEEIKKNHKNFEFDQESNSIKPKKSKKEDL